MEGAPKQNNQERIQVKKPYYQNGELLGHEVGWMYDEFALSTIDSHPHKRIEFETESGNVYTIRLCDTDVAASGDMEWPQAKDSDSTFVISNKKTGTVNFLSQKDIESGVIKVGEPFKWQGGNSTNVKNILFYTKGEVHLVKK